MKKKQKPRIIVVDVSKCMGCRSCEIACAVEHSNTRNIETAIWEETKPVSRVRVGKAGEAAVPLQCRQCENAPCVTVCLAKALHRPDKHSPVLIDRDRCIGCMCCILACPFGVITTDCEGGTIIKCDQCHERVGKGELPSCVSACPTGALKFVSVEDIVAGKRSAYLVEIAHALGGGEE